MIVRFAMPSARRRWLLALGVIGGCALLLGILFVGVLPGVVERRVVSALEARTGLSVSVDSVGIRPRSVRLEGLRLSSPGDAISLSVDELQVYVAVFQTLMGSAHVERVEGQGGAALVDLTKPELPSVLARLRGAEPTTASRSDAAAAGTASAGEPGAAEPSRASATEPTGTSVSLSGAVVELEDLRVAVRDSVGTLVLVEGAELYRDPLKIRFASHRIELGERGARGQEWASLESAWAGLARAGGTTQLENLVAAHGEVHWAAPGDANDEASDRRLVSRLAAARRALREPAADEPEDAAEEAKGYSFAERLSPRLRVDIGRIEVHGRARDGSEASAVVREVGVGLADDGRLHSVGLGADGAGVSVGWDLYLDLAREGADGTLRVVDLPLAFVAPLVPFLPLGDAPDGRLGADLELRTEPSGEIAFEGRFEVREAVLDSERIAATPVRGLSFALRGAGLFAARERRVAWKRGSLSVGDVELRLSASVTLADEGARGELEAVLPPTSCAAVIAALPADVLGPVSEFELRGTMGGRAKLHVDLAKLDATEVELDVADGCEFVAIPGLANVERFAYPFEHQALEPDGTVFTMTTGPGTPAWAPIGAIHPNVVSAIMSHEDASFPLHHGFAPWAIRDALVKNLEAGAFRFGASTISMQLTKNLFLRREKTLVRKIQEVFLTWWLERALDKDRILELYLNVIEYGPNLYGIRGATLHYFGREPADVSPAEAAFLATILPSPKRAAPMYEAGVPTESTRRRMGQLMRHMASRGRLSPEALAYGLAELPVMRFHRLEDPPPLPRQLPGDSLSGFGLSFDGTGDTSASDGFDSNAARSGDARLTGPRPIAPTEESDPWLPADETSSGGEWGAE